MLTTWTNIRARHARLQPLFDHRRHENGAGPRQRREPHRALCTRPKCAADLLRWATDLRQRSWRRHAFREELARAFESLGVLVPASTGVARGSIGSRLLARAGARADATAPADGGIRALIFSFPVRKARTARRAARAARRSSSSAFLRRLAYARIAFVAAVGSFTSSTMGALRASSTNSSSASRMRRRASSTVRPCVWQPRTPRRRPSTSPTRLARKPRDKTSRLLQPSLSEARLQVTLDTSQQTGPDVLTRMNRYGCHTLAAFDA